VQLTSTNSSIGLIYALKKIFLILINMKIQFVKKKSKSELITFFKSFKDTKIEHLIEESKVRNLSLNEKMFKQKNPYKPQLNDLYRLYQLITQNKRLCVLEFGCGWSSLIINKAILKNKKNLESKTSKIRQFNKFKHFSVDNDKKFINITKNRIPRNNISSFLYSECKVTNVNNNFAFKFEKLPNICPDFIYIDGPDLFKVKGKLNNITFNNPDRIPILSDILFFEYQLLPGTIILFDGRTTNARFLKDNLKRKWKYIYDKKNDQNILFLDEKPIGIHNLNQLKFYGYMK
jgi:hypothetical protein